MKVDASQGERGMTILRHTRLKTPPLRPLVQQTASSPASHLLNDTQGCRIQHVNWTVPRAEPPFQNHRGSWLELRSDPAETPWNTASVTNR